MTPFERAIEFVLRFEGGYSNDPNDDGNWTGGEKGKGELKGTKFGISAKAYPKLHIYGLTRGQCIALYRKHYWDACKCDQLPEGIAFVVFDAAVNQGVNASIRMLQNSLNVTSDGVIGPVTLKAATLADNRETLTSLIAERCLRYTKAKTIAIYGRGWFRRVASCLMASLEQH